MSRRTFIAAMGLLLVCPRHEALAALITGGDLVLVVGEGRQDFGLLALRYLEVIQGPLELRCHLIEL